MQPNPTTGGYAELLQNQELFSSGSQLTITAAGARVPGFTAQVIAPAAATLTAPVCSGMDCGSISKAAGLSVAWTGGTGTMAIQVAPPSSGLDVVCRFPAASGAGTIPAAALATLPLGPTQFLVTTQNETMVQAGPFPVTVVAMSTSILAATLQP
ncbi:MAG: hypothetical protein JNJ54_10525 [Myxococcaceae bacterium]|nr:hypothetical protein [Myxococcaceae bacterium]